MVTAVRLKEMGQFLRYSHKGMKLSHAIAKDIAQGAFD